MTDTNQTTSDFSDIENMSIEVVYRTLTVGEAISIYDGRANPDGDAYDPELRQQYLALMAEGDNAQYLLALAKQGIQNQIEYMEIDEEAAAKYAISGTELEEKMFGVMHEGYEEGEGEEEWDEDDEDYTEEEN